LSCSDPRSGDGARRRLTKPRNPKSAAAAADNEKRQQETTINEQPEMGRQQPQKSRSRVKSRKEEEEDGVEATAAAAEANEANPAQRSSATLHRPLEAAASAAAVGSYSILLVLHYTFAAKYSSMLR
jgi:hypothetical protein